MVLLPSEKARLVLGNFFIYFMMIRSYRPYNRALTLLTYLFLSF